jgi:hypothetical protein
MPPSGGQNKICPLARASGYIKTSTAAREGSLSGPLRCRATAILPAALCRVSLCFAQEGRVAKIATVPARAEMAEGIPTVIVIVDDPAIRESIGGLLRSVGPQAKLFASVKAGRPA